MATMEVGISIVVYGKQKAHKPCNYGYLIMDIHNSIVDIHNSIMDIHNSIMDVHNCKPITNKAVIMDIHN